ncbi:MAG TPA: acyl-CoA synthetase [Solirubrobacteraceae bacterium]|nr:acyl-CoA synthetase [Solirubrobacteraceae bacterium]
MELLDPFGLLSGATKLLERFGDEAYYVALCIRAGLVGPEMPHKVAQMLLSFERYGMLGGGMSLAGLRHGNQLALIDERGELTYKELDRRVNSLATAWRRDGLKAGDGVAILARNHRGFLEAFFAAAKCGSRIILFNTSFSGPQVREVAEREGVDLFVFDEEFSELVEGVDPQHGRWLSWADSHPDAEDTLDALIESAPDQAPPKPEHAPKVVILTSGTTGTPKGAGRDVPWSLSPIGGLLSKVPFRAREVTELSVPMFHALGFSQALLGVALGSTLVLHRKFDPAETLNSLQEHGASAMVVVPVMLQRMLGLDDSEWEGKEFPNLRIIFVSGSQLGEELASRVTERFGKVIYNLYGSTEIAFATIATPDDLEAAPSTVGQVVHGAVVKILDDEGNDEVKTGESGRIFVGNSIQFEGYTGGGSKDEVGGLMASGDVGHFDEKGRLFIDGRDDEMIVSGGENVFPAEVEELLVKHDGVAEAAAIGVEDEDFGQRLKAFVVKSNGADLSEDDVKAYVKENLARYKVPREVVFIDELPRNATGKVLKRELEESDDEDPDHEGTDDEQSDHK